MAFNAGDKVVIRPADQFIKELYPNYGHEEIEREKNVFKNILDMQDIIFTIINISGELAELMPGNYSLNVFYLETIQFKRIREQCENKLKNVVILDDETFKCKNIYWKSLGTYEWNEAVLACLTIGKEWKLPSPKELQTLFAENIEELVTLSKINSKFSIIEDFYWSDKYPKPNKNFPQMYHVHIGIVNSNNSHPIIDYRKDNEAYNVLACSKKFNRRYNNKVGLSLSRCIKDIIDNKISVDEIEFIFAGTKIDFSNPVQKNGIIQLYTQKDWSSNPAKATLVLEKLLKSKKIIQPRILGCKAPKSIEKIWVDTLDFKSNIRDYIETNGKGLSNVYKDF